MTELLPEPLTTERLILRKPREPDAAAVFETYTQDPEVARWTVWRPHTCLAQSAAFIDECIQGWHSGAAQAYMMALRDHADAAIGVIEVRLRAPLADIGYVLSRSHWGKGFVPEAIRALATLVLADPRACFLYGRCR